LRKFKNHGISKQIGGGLHRPLVCHPFDRLRTGLGYDPKRGTAFSTYAWPCIMRQVWREVKVHNRFRSPPATGDALPLLHEPDPALVWETAVVQQVFTTIPTRPSPLRGGGPPQPG